MTPCTRPTHLFRPHEAKKLYHFLQARLSAGWTLHVSTATGHTAYTRRHASLFEILGGAVVVHQGARCVALAGEWREHAGRTLWVSAQTSAPSGDEPDQQKTPMTRRPRRLTVELDARDAEWLEAQLLKVAELLDGPRVKRRLYRIARAFGAAPIPTSSEEPAR